MVTLKEKIYFISIKSVESLMNLCFNNQLLPFINLQRSTYINIAILKEADNAHMRHQDKEKISKFY